MNNKDNNNKKIKHGRTVYLIAAAAVLLAVIILLAVLLSKCGKAPDGPADTGDPVTGALTGETAEHGTDPADTQPAQPSHVHDFGQWTVLAEPACITPGEHARTCKTCGFVLKEELPPLGHDGHNNECVRCGKKAAPAEQLEISPYQYGEGLWITDVSRVTDPDFLVPDVYDGQPIVCIAASVIRDNETVTSISLPDSVTQLGTFFCYNCPNLRMIKLGRNIDNQYTAITGFCPQIDYLTVDPDNKKLHSDHNCIIETETKKLLYGCRNSIIPDDGSVLVLDNSSFQDCTGLTSIVIPSPVTTIESHAFTSCRALVSVQIANSVTTIEENVFSDCSSLKNVRLPAHITVLDNQLFEYCEALEEITVPEGVTEIYSECFYDCKSLKTVRLPESLKRINNYAFQKCYSLESITLPSGLTNLGEAFKECTSLRSVAIPDGVEELYTGTFLDCSSLTEIKFPKNLDRFPRLLFKGCTSLTSVTVPDGVITIDDYAFSGCSSLQTVTLPASLRYVYDDIFKDCTALTAVYYEGTAEDWAKIRISQANEALQNVTVVYGHKN